MFGAKIVITVHDFMEMKVLTFSAVATVRATVQYDTRGPGLV